MSSASRLQGLYVITDRELFLSLEKDISELVKQAILGGARIVQYRNKISSTATRSEEARELLTLCRKHNVTLLINDDVELARDIDADGVHIGQSDMPLAEARSKLGKGKIIGVTCHNRLELAQSAQTAGADYVAFGRFFPSKTKPLAPPASVNILQQAKEQLSIPVVAIGGITTSNAQILINHGADMLAVSHSVFGASDIIASAKQLGRLFDLVARQTNIV
jgi:thiamine-phosphate pyrophosphorylase